MHNQLKDHLFPGDGNEAVAIVMCGRHTYDSDYFLMAHKIMLIPYKECEIRGPDFLRWSTKSIGPFIEEAAKKNLAIVKFHSHPNGYAEFSRTDDKSDKDIFASIYGWMDSDEPHGSVVMLPDGSMFGRVVDTSINFISIDKIMLCGDNIRFYHKKNQQFSSTSFQKRTAQALGEGTTGLLKSLKVGVIGCSGTGSPTIEQLVRLGIGTIVLIDPDRVEEKNLNRILNTTMKNARMQEFKVDVLKTAIDNIGLGTNVITFNQNLYDDKEVINCLAACDFLIGCMDSVDGRYLLNQISSFYSLPYFDLGVKIIADGNGGIEQICGSVHYIQPGGGSLRTRGVYTPEEVRSASMYRTNPMEFEEQKKAGYIVNVKENSPAVISINMYTSSIAVNEFLARLHGFRYDDNKGFAVTKFSLTDSYLLHESDDIIDTYLSKYVGRGNMSPLLNMPELTVS